MPKNFEQINSENKKSNEQAELEESISAAEHICPDIKGGVEQVIRTEKKDEKDEQPEQPEQPEQIEQAESAESTFPYNLDKGETAKQEKQVSVLELSQKEKTELETAISETQTKIRSDIKSQVDKKMFLMQGAIKREIENQLLTIERNPLITKSQLAECQRLKIEAEKDPIATAYEIMRDALVEQEKSVSANKSELTKIRQRDRLASAIKLAEIITGRDFQKEAEEKLKDKYQNISEKEYLSPKNIFEKKIDIKKESGTDDDEDILKKRYGWTTAIEKRLFNRKLIYKNKDGKKMGELKINMFGAVVNRPALVKHFLDQEVTEELKNEYKNRQQAKQQELEQYKEQELKNILEKAPASTAVNNGLENESILTPSSASNLPNKKEFNLEGIDLDKKAKDITSENLVEKVKEVSSVLGEINNADVGDND